MDLINVNYYFELSILMWKCNFIPFLTALSYLQQSFNCDITVINF